MKGRGQDVGLDNGWVAGAAAVGSAATVVAVVLLWFLLTHPVAVAELLAGGFPS